MCFQTVTDVFLLEQWICLVIYDDKLLYVGKQTFNLIFISFIVVNLECSSNRDKTDLLKYVLYRQLHKKIYTTLEEHTTILQIISNFLSSLEMIFFRYLFQFIIILYSFDESFTYSYNIHGNRKIINRSAFDKKKISSLIHTTISNQYVLCTKYLFLFGFHSYKWKQKSIVL